MNSIWKQLIFAFFSKLNTKSFYWRWDPVSVQNTCLFLGWRLRSRTFDRVCQYWVELFWHLRFAIWTGNTKEWYNCSCSSWFLRRFRPLTIWLNFVNFLECVCHVSWFCLHFDKFPEWKVFSKYMAGTAFFKVLARWPSSILSAFKHIFGLLGLQGIYHITKKAVPQNSTTLLC